MDSLKQKFDKEISLKLKGDLNKKNIHSVPKLSKVVINMGVRGVLAEKKNMEKAMEIMTLITGQKPKITKARKSISTFKLREGEQIGLMATLRGKRMYDFFGKLVNVAFPRIRDFHGVPLRSFDGKGNYTLGFAESSFFPEIDLGKIEFSQGMEIAIVTTAKDDKEAEVLLRALGMPFQK
jgi:large subunit ribosomal protein L5